MQKLRDALHKVEWPKRGITFALAGLILGISFSYYLKTFYLLIVLFSLCIFIYLSLLRDKKNTLVLLSFLVIGAMYQGVRSCRKPFDGERTFSGYVMETKNNYFLFKCNGVPYYVYEKGCEREIGDILIIDGSSSKYISTEYESYFSFTDYLQKKGVTHKITPYKIEERFSIPLRLRKKEIKFLSSFDKDTAGLIDSLLFDHRDYSLSTLDTASQIGIIYFMSASGLIYAAFLSLFERLVFFKLDEKKSKILTIVFGTFFLPFLILKPGVIRVYLTRLSKLLFFDVDYEIKPDHIAHVSCVSFLMVFANPYLALTAGFLVSIGISIGMQLVRGRIMSHRIGKRTIVSFLYAYSFVFPMLIDKNCIHLLSPFYSTFCLPMVYPFIFISWISFLTIPFVSPLKFYGNAISSFVNTLSKADIQIPVGNWTPFLGCIAFSSIFGFYYFRDVGLTNFKNGCAITIIGILLLNPIPVETPFVESVSFINVGQGDSILIRAKNTVVMIDTGGATSFDIASNVLIPYLRKEKIYHIDYLIGTHDDADHIGGKESLISKYKVKKYIDNIEYFPLNVGTLFFRNLNIYQDSWKEENDTSLVLYLEFMNKRWLFTGDASTNIEKLILEDNPGLDCDILKVGHHGSKTSSSEEFIKTITPETAIISVGAANKYGHPDQEVLNTLASIGAKIRRTDIEGTITYKRYVSPL